MTGIVAIFRLFERLAWRRGEPIAWANPFTGETELEWPPEYGGG